MGSNFLGPCFPWLTPASFTLRNVTENKGADGVTIHTYHRAPAEGWCLHVRITIAKTAADVY